MIKLAIWDSKVKLTALAAIHSSCCTRVIKGRFIGFAVYNGDDAVAHLADWISGIVWPLQYSHSDSNSEYHAENGVKLIFLVL